jgi:hypothetical protein
MQLLGKVLKGTATPKEDVKSTDHRPSGLNVIPLSGALSKDSAVNLMGKFGMGKDTSLNLFNFALQREVHHSTKAFDKPERILVYVERGVGAPKRAKLNFDSPRTSIAANRLGIDYADCLKR